MLFVCTGNVCRSPVAEKLFGHRAAGSYIASASAGIAGLAGYGIDEPSALALRELNGDPSGHVARRVTPSLVAAADLILTADGDHRSSIVQTAPKTFRRTFTLREFGRLGAGLPQRTGAATPQALRARVADVAEQRGLVDVPEPGEDDIGDPFGAGLEVARLTVAQISTAIDAVIQVLGLRDLSRRLA